MNRLQPARAGCEVFARIRLVDSGNKNKPQQSSGLLGFFINFGCGDRI